MIPQPNQIMTAVEVRRAHLTRLVAELVEAGVAPEVVMRDARDGLYPAAAEEPAAA